VVYYLRGIFTLNVLIVEDERNLADALAQIMKRQRINAETVYDGALGLDYALSGIYDLIVLDVMLPKLNGFEVVKRMREEKNSTPVIMLTARDEIPDKVRGLDCGADDYMTKPFAPEELLARVRALSRRQGEVILDKLEFGDLSLDLGSNTLCRGSKSIRLGYRECEVLKILMSNTSIIIPKEKLITKVWGGDSEAEDNTVEAHISFLRKKFSYLGSAVEIETIRKVGYRLVEDGQDL
jgi:DNA-binding response OmpR family regulator